MTEDCPILKKSSILAPQQTRRKGIKERRLLALEESPYQNAVIIDAEHGAEVEFHQITTSESIFVLAGMFEVTLADYVQKLEAGDFYYFPPNSSHGLRCAKGPGQFLIIFAPPRYANQSPRR